MKKIALIMCFVLMISVFSACVSTEKSLPDGQTEVFSTDEEVYEAMTGAAEEGNYKSAVAYYSVGGAGAEKEDSRDWYLYAVAMDEHKEYNCIGYPLDLLSEKVNEDFEPAKEKIEELREQAKEFNDIYSNNGKYIYICDGKIGTSVDVLVSDFIFCAYEIAEKDGVFYWTEHKQDGTHTDLYTIEKEDNKLVVTATKDNTVDIFSGTYDIFVAEMPMLCY